jgi:hypothetical protein
VLRGLGQYFPHTCHVQWSGQKHALVAFLQGGMPHAVDGIVALGPPGRLVREGPAGGIAALSSLETLQRQ